MWRTANLENSQYNRLMSAPSLSEITPDLVMAAYGYNAITKYMQPNMLKGVDISLPYKGTLFTLSNALARTSNNADLYLPLDIVAHNDNGVLVDNVRYVCSQLMVRFIYNLPMKNLVARLRSMLTTTKKTNHFV